jgi:hypothetical protein
VWAGTTDAAPNVEDGRRRPLQGCALCRCGLQRFRTPRVMQAARRLAALRRERCGHLTLGGDPLGLVRKRYSKATSVGTHGGRRGRLGPGLVAERHDLRRRSDADLTVQRQLVS